MDRLSKKVGRLKAVLKAQENGKIICKKCPLRNRCGRFKGEEKRPNLTCEEALTVYILNGDCLI